MRSLGIALTLIFCFFGYQSSHAASVWKVTNGENTLYLAGTIHILSPDDYPLPAQFQSAYEASEVMVFETDISAMNSPDMQQKSMEMLTYTDGTTIDQVLQKETLNKLNSHLMQRGVPLANLETFKPTLLSLTLTMIEFQAIGLTTQGVDAFYYTTAMGDGKMRKWLETPEQQLNFIANMATGDEDEMILYTLKDLESLPSRMGELKEAWRAGDMDTLAAIGLTPWIEEYADIYQAIFVERNNNWVPEIKEMLTTPKTEMVLVGALHMPGEHGLLTQLSQQGYTITQLK
ncbi:TraB/GumN family protein [Alteromonas sediminis]|nr:TraB/GumN family protein [Alteromonas sediminis]